MKLKTKKIIGILLLSQLIFVSFAQAQNVYHNSRGHFSFTIPQGWEEIPQSVVNDASAGATQMARRTITYIAGFTTQAQYPYMYIQLDSSGRMSETKIQQIATPARQKKILGIAENGLKDLPIELGKLVYQKEMNAIYQTNIANNGGRRIVNLAVLMFYKFGFVTLSFNSLEENYEKDASEIDAIINSFKFDEGYRY